MKNLKEALKEWVSLLNTKRVITNEIILRESSIATFKTTQKILAILKPISSMEVAAIMKIATRHSIPVYPISGGKNWGLGSKVPQNDGVIIDLSLMKRIVQFDETMAFITVQPGVTFKAVEDFLVRKKSNLMLDTIGSTPQASIIGNTAERGHGMALYADRFNFVCGFEVVLPNGEVIKTGFENIKSSKLGSLAKWGLGPYVDGLFTQSNLGIITKLTLWLRPKPKFFQSFTFHVTDEKKLGKLIDQFRQMGLEGLNASLRIFNDIRMISFGARFPENEKVPLSNTKRLALRKQRNIGKWIGLGGLYAISQQHAVADKAFIISRIGMLVDKIIFYDKASVDTQYVKGDQSTKDELDFLFNKSLLRGNTSSAGLNMIYWRKSPSVRMKDIHQDQCGVIWYCPSIPFTGKDTKRAIKICEEICKKYKFEINIGFLFISQRTLEITGAICYDRSVEGEDMRAMQCHDAIMDRMIECGYSPYRIGIQSMNLMKIHSKEGAAFLNKLKMALDPNHILAPGHYIF